MKAKTPVVKKKFAPKRDTTTKTEETELIKVEMVKFLKKGGKVTKCPAKDAYIYGGLNHGGR